MACCLNSLDPLANSLLESTCFLKAILYCLRCQTKELGCFANIDEPTTVIPSGGSMQEGVLRRGLGS